MTVSNEERGLITNLIMSCNELIDGKFILADSKISKILKDIADSKEVFNLLSECMQSFNFEKEFARAKIKTPTKPGYFKMPEEKYKILPMVFCMLVDIESRKIDFPVFLREYFVIPDSQMSEYKNFANEVIRPFRNAVSEVFDLPLIISERMQKAQLINKIESQDETIISEDEEDNKEMECKDMNEIDEIMFKDVNRIVSEIVAVLETDYHLKDNVRDSGVIMLNGMLRACELKDIKILNALLIGFEPIGNVIKSIRFVYKELKDRMVEYYESF